MVKLKHNDLLNLKKIKEEDVLDLSETIPMSTNEELVDVTIEDVIQDVKDKDVIQDVKDEDVIQDDVNDEDVIQDDVNDEEVIHDDTTQDIEENVLDLSDTQKLDIIIETKVVEKHKVPKWVLPTMALLFLSLASVITLFVNQSSSEAQVATQQEVQVSRTSQSEQNTDKAFTAELKKKADETGTPYAVSTEPLGGGYTLGITTYNPNKTSDIYMDYAIKAPDEKQPVIDDDTAKKIEENLKKDLPTINVSIHVKDKDKVTMETYKLDDKYQTILLYDAKPFAYVVTDKDGMSTNYVTSYYVTDVASE